MPADLEVSQTQVTPSSADNVPSGAPSRAEAGDTTHRRPFSPSSSLRRALENEFGASVGTEPSQGSPRVNLGAAGLPSSPAHYPINDASTRSIRGSTREYTSAALDRAAIRRAEASARRNARASISIPDSIAEEDELTHGDSSPPAAPYTSFTCLLYTSPSPRDRQKSRMPSSA